MLILILIDAQYLQNVVFSFEKKVKMVKITPREIPTTRQKNPPVKFPIPLPLNGIWKTLPNFKNNCELQIMKTFP